MWLNVLLTLSCWFPLTFLTPCSGINRRHTALILTEFPLAGSLTSVAPSAPAAQAWALLTLAADGLGPKAVSKLCYKPRAPGKICKQYTNNSVIYLFWIRKWPRGYQWLCIQTRHIRGDPTLTEHDAMCCIPQRHWPSQQPDWTLSTRTIRAMEGYPKWGKVKNQWSFINWKIGQPANW